MGVTAISVVLTLLAASFLLPFRASAAPKPTVDQVRQQIKALTEQAEVASEHYNDLREQISGLNVRIEAAKAKVTEQQKAVAHARGALAKIAADTYKAGDLATLSLFLSDHPDDYVSANGLLMSLDDRSNQVMQDVLNQQRQLVASMTDVQEQQQKLEKARSDLQATRVDVEKKINQQTTLLMQLSAEDRNRLGRLQAGEDRTSLEDLGIKVPTSGLLQCDDVPVVAPNARAGKALAYACAQIGDPYRWAGSGPSSFDCSGLMMAAWSAAGVSLPHSSQQQASSGTKVTVAQLQPGDLVFFYAGLTHVGMYVGKGLMLHAPHSGDVVRIAPIGNRTVVTAVRL